jgi:hypothetical protein
MNPFSAKVVLRDKQIENTHLACPPYQTSKEISANAKLYVFANIKLLTKI